jgi:type II restriction enzyme
MKHAKNSLKSSVTRRFGILASRYHVLECARTSESHIELSQRHGDREMRLEFEPCDGRYVSLTQSARVWTEQWVETWAYCPNCGHTKIDKYPNNRPVADFFCSACDEQFELKSTKSKFGARVTDGAYASMCRRLADSDNPNLMLLNYESARGSETDFFIVPKHFFVRAMIQPRKPLSPSARRAGWIGCNILLNSVPSAGKIFYVEHGRELPRRFVLEKWRQTAFLRRASSEARGWLMDIMRCIGFAPTERVRNR